MFMGGCLCCGVCMLGLHTSASVDACVQTSECMDPQETLVVVTVVKGVLLQKQCTCCDSGQWCASASNVHAVTVVKGVLRRKQCMRCDSGQTHASAKAMHA